MLGADLTIKLDQPFGTVDYALIERVVHQALVEARIPVVDVEMDGVREVDAPLPTGAPPPDVPLGPFGLPRTAPPGGRY